MLQKLLLRWLGLATVDLGRVARALADDLLKLYEPDELDRRTTQQFLRTQYMRLVHEYGLPAEPCSEVAERAWASIARLREDEPDAATSDQEFRFYD